MRDLLLSRSKSLDGIAAFGEMVVVATERGRGAEDRGLGGAEEGECEGGAQSRQWS